MAVYPFKAFMAYSPNSTVRKSAAKKVLYIFFFIDYFTSGFSFDFTFLVNGPAFFLLCVCSGESGDCKILLLLLALALALPTWFLPLLLLLMHSFRGICCFLLHLVC